MNELVGIYYNTLVFTQGTGYYLYIIEPLRYYAEPSIVEATWLFPAISPLHSPINEKDTTNGQ